jgi:RHS repeat-associated protein
VPTAIASADINRDGVVDERDVSLFVNGWVQGEIDRRLDVNNNGRLETGPPIDPANGLPISNWDDDDLSLFTKEFVALYEWRLNNEPTPPDPTTALFDGTGTDADGIARGKLSREDIDNRIGAAGMWWDPHLGIYHVRHRAYDPRLGRFLQPDPIGVAGGWNVFEYVGGDPANFVDPSGLFFRTYHHSDWFVYESGGAAYRTREVYRTGWFGIGIPEYYASEVENLTSSGISLQDLRAADSIGVNDQIIALRDANDELVRSAADEISNELSSQAISLGTGALASRASRLAGKAGGKTGQASEVAAEVATEVVLESALNAAQSSCGGEPAKADPVPTPTDADRYRTPEGQAKKKGWKVGDPIDSLTAAGKEPAWSTVRERFWKNEAATRPGEYSQGDMERMSRGRPPLEWDRDLGKLVEIELHHPDRRSGENFYRFDKVTPSEHARRDPHRSTGGKRGR